MAPDVLSEMLREAERAVDHQLRTLEELDDKSEQLLTMGLATVGGGAALSAFLLEREAIGPLQKAWLGFTIVVALSSIGAFLVPYVGFFRRTDSNVGPSLRWLAEKANDATWSSDQHYVSLVQSYHAYFDQNALLITEHRRANKWGLVVLATAVVGFSAATFYVLW